MRRQKFTLLVLILLCVASVAILLPRAHVSTALTAVAAVPRPFVVFDATL